MKRTKQPAAKKQPPSLSEKKKPGRKSSCTEEVIQEAFNLCLLGMTNDQMAHIFGKDSSTIDYWYRNNPRFRQAVDKGRDRADGEVVKKLYQMAMGYSYPAVKFFKNRVKEDIYDEDGNLVKTRTHTEIIKQEYTKHLPPNVKAALKFLAARNRETWGQAHRVKHKHEHMHAGDMNIHHLMEQVGPQNFSDQELETLMKLGMTEKSKQITNGSEQ